MLQHGHLFPIVIEPDVEAVRGARLIMSLETGMRLGPRELGDADHPPLPLTLRAHEEHMNTFLVRTYRPLDAVVLVRPKREGDAGTTGTLPACACMACIMAARCSGENCGSADCCPGGAIAAVGVAEVLHAIVNVAPIVMPHKRRQPMRI